MAHEKADTKEEERREYDTADVLAELEAAALAEGEPDEGELAAAEALVADRVERSLDPFREMFPPDVADEMEDDLRCFLLTHPVSHDMLARVRPYLRTTSGSNTAEVVPTKGKAKAG
jgi:hypothetical protein